MLIFQYMIAVPTGALNEFARAPEAGAALGPIPALVRRGRANKMARRLLPALLWFV